MNLAADARELPRIGVTDKYELPRIQIRVGNLVFHARSFFNWICFFF